MDSMSSGRICSCPDRPRLGRDPVGPPLGEPPPVVLVLVNG
jgi:hypothetical protein